MMKVLKSLYIIWVVFWGIILLYGSLYAYFSDMEFFGDMLKSSFFIYSYPLLPYLSYLVLKKVIESKNIFIYFYLFLFIAGSFLNYMIALGIYTLSFLIISIKFRRKFPLYFSLLFSTFLYFSLLLFILW
ncbi:hypothetical protein [Campylobacter helveticus]|uniref:hypothetical protein n=1 Tax=Campylobacter helveticus TaxID=28898 RepID=UPI00164F16E6|nr:hypothetical protein [Campylobacter helveticus]